MANPLSGIISANLKQTFKNAIDALLESTALSLPCTVVYGVTKFETCPNCIINPMTGVSIGKYNGTGTKPFSSGLCPVCNGEAKIKTKTTETLYLGVVYDIKKWQAVPTQNIPAGSVLTISTIDYLPKLNNAERIIINSNIDDKARNEFQKLGDPQPMGLGEDAYVAFLWKKVA